MGIDPRIIRIGIEVRGQFRFYEDLAITASGIKYTNPNLGECNISIANLEKNDADFILTETSPFNLNRTAKRITVEAGRQSTGLSLLFTGNIFRSSITQPPDRVLNIRALSGFFAKGNIVSNSFAGSSAFSSIAQRVADDLGLSLSFQSDDKNVSNYNFTGGATNQLNKLAELADVDVFIDNNQLIIIDKANTVLGRSRELDADNGMIGTPTFTEQGAKVTFLYDQQTVPGSELCITSRQYPALTGDYKIYKLNYDLSNRDVPFYYTAECIRLGGRA